jgi:hypothetical protein
LFETSIRTLLSDRTLANKMVASAQEFLAAEYNQEQIIKTSLCKS